MKLPPYFFNISRISHPHYAVHDVPTLTLPGPSAPTSMTGDPSNANCSNNDWRSPSMPIAEILHHLPCRAGFQYCGWELFKQGWDMEHLRSDFTNLTSHTDYNISTLWNMIFTCAGPDLMYVSGLCGSPEPGLQTECHGPLAECGSGDTRWYFGYQNQPIMGPEVNFTFVNDSASVDWRQNPGWAP